ncbi:hypothetical protein C0073_022770 (plasmid) [Aeromonas veronii]|nr:hypothetical protein C0073_022060 [Aeromonas veronii]AYK20525.1 hypothetical protein C0073_022770 [Aeromonas veronii]
MVSDCAVFGSAGRVLRLNAILLLLGRTHRLKVKATELLMLKRHEEGLASVAVVFFGQMASQFCTHRSGQLPAIF